ncbi:MAG: hypothetical protein KGV48_000195 [Alcaligenaceae bacterium]|nr:hypothetical protein [Alcaligenaceae bacterium]
MKKYTKLSRYLGIMTATLLLNACGLFGDQVSLYDQDGNPIIPGQTTTIEESKPIDLSSFKVLIVDNKPNLGYAHQRIGGSVFYVNTSEYLDIQSLYDLQTIRTRGNRVTLRFVFNTEGAKKLKDMTAKHHGELLLMSNKNKILARYRIKGVAKQDFLMIDNLTRAEAKAIQEEILASN